MTINKFLQWMVEHEEYVPLYSPLVATLALGFSILSFVISNLLSKKRAKTDKKISDVRYEEQKEQYEKRLNEERRLRKEDKQDMEEKNRISEEPYLVFKSSKVVSAPSSEQIIIRMEFLNKGRGSAYEIIPDVECKANTMCMEEFLLHRYSAVEDPVAMVGELFVVSWTYASDEKKRIFRMTPTIAFRDASGRNYKQTYCIDIIDSHGNANIINYATPKLCEE